MRPRRPPWTGLLAAAITAATGAVPTPAPAAAAVAPSAPPPSAAPPTAPAPDYSAGFERLFALGLPDVRGAAWMEESDKRGVYKIEHQGVTYRPPPSGFFLLPEQAPGVRPGVAGLDEFYYVEPPPFGTPDAGDAFPTLSPALEKLADTQSISIRDWRIVAGRLDAQFAAVGVWVEKYDDLENAPIWDAADCLIFAAHLHRLGRAAEANNLAALLFARCDQREVLADVVRKFALHRYNTALSDASAPGKSDWAAFAKALDDLLARYGGNWPERPLVERVRTEAHRQAALPARPVLPGPEWSEEDRAFATLLLERYVNYDAMGGQHSWMILQTSWLFPLGSTRITNRQEPHDKTAALLAQRGAKSLLVLAALAEDDTWVGGDVVLQRINEASIRPHEARNRGELSDEARERMWIQTFPRPLSRSEIAGQLLKSVAPAEFVRETRFGIAREVGDKPGLLKWAKAAAGIPTAMLARAYLVEDAASPTSAQAWQWLARNAQGEDAKFFERQVLEQNSLWDTHDYAAAYLDHRGAAVKPFAQALIVKVNDALANPPRFISELFVTQLEQLREKASDVVDGVTLVQRLQALPAVSEADWPKALAYVEARFTDETLAAVDAAAAIELVRETSGARRRDSLELLSPLTIRPADPARTRLIGEQLRVHAEAWRSLLADKTNANESYRDRSLGDIAAEVVVENLAPGFEPELFSKSRQRLQELGEARAAARYRRHAVALLAGAPLTEPFTPEPLPLPPEKLAALTTAVRAGDRPAWLGGIAALSDGEYLTWQKTLAQDPAFARAAMSLANRINTVTRVGEPMPADIAAWGAGLEGQPFTADLVENLLALAERETRAGRGGRIWLERAADGTGWAIRWWVSGDEPEKIDFVLADRGLAGVGIDAYANDDDDTSANVRRRFQDGATLPEEPAAEDEQALRATLAALAVGRVKGGVHGRVSIAYVPAGPGGETNRLLRMLDAVARPPLR